MSTASVLSALVVAVSLLGSAGAAQAESAPPRDASAQRSAAGAAASVESGLRMDRQVEALTATGYQTALVAGVAGGVVLAGIAVGTHAAVVVGTAVVVGYLFLPWE